MKAYIQFQEGNHIFYLHRISAYLAYGREVTAADQNIIYEGYYKHYVPTGWQRITF